ncbi:hypothetical protein BGZ95_010676 [Linnemannia exigua]|uniref:Uncharacterized protein n=1 Tax=Linnemannia exigua TaxID=604196 RepID=A0AAD4DB02_9FUNG|nr:hypothetical protein BGZ95_010676 [Linnemannia exigua]
MRLFSATAEYLSVSRKQHSPSHQKSPISSSRSTTSTARSMTWSVLCTLVILNSFLALLSPSTSGGLAHAAPDIGFCADCKTFSNAIGVCGGTFGPADIEKPGEYVLQQAYAKCTCTEVMQKVLWTCAKCEYFAGKGSQGVPPKKHKMTCLDWGITVAEYAMPYTGVVEPGTTTDLTGGGTPNPPPTTTTTTVNPIPPTDKPTTGGGGGGTSTGGNGKPSGTSSDPSSPSASHDSLNGDKTETGSTGPNTAAIGISVGIIGVAFVAGIMTVVMMKRRRRRRSPLDLDSSPALANFVALEDKWDNKPSRYGEGSVVGGGYDAQYDGHYDAYGHHGGYDAQYEGYGQGVHGYSGGGGQQYDHYQGSQYDQGYDQGYHPGQQDAYQMHDYGYDQHVVAASQRQGLPPYQGEGER